MRAVSGLSTTLSTAAERLDLRVQIDAGDGDLLAAVAEGVDGAEQRARSVSERSRIDLRAISLSERSQNRGGCDGSRRSCAGSWGRCAVARGRPGHDSVLHDDGRTVVLQDERTVGQVVPGQRVQLPPMGAAVDPLGMEPLVDLLGEQRRPVVGARDRERVAELVVCRPAAERAGAVAGGERDGLVVEEEQGEVVGLPLRKAPILEAQRAGDPEVTGMEAHHVVAAVEDASVAAPGSPQRDSDDLAERGHSVSSGSLVRGPETVTGGSRAVARGWSGTGVLIHPVTLDGSTHTSPCCMAFVAEPSGSYRRAVRFFRSSRHVLPVEPSGSSGRAVRFFRITSRGPAAVPLP